SFARLQSRLRLLESEQRASEDLSERLADELEASAGAATGTAGEPNRQVLLRALEILGERSQRSCPRGPAAAEAIAHALANAVTAPQAHRCLSAAERADLRALALTHVAAARRVRGDFRAAHEAFAEAQGELAAGSSDPLPRAYLALRLAALL